MARQEPSQRPREYEKCGLASAMVWPAAGQSRPPAQAMVTVCFVAPDDCSTLIIQTISAARSRVRIAAYELTSAPIVAALVGAHARGVDVQAVLDPANLRPIGRRPGSAVALAAAASRFGSITPPASRTTNSSKSTMPGDWWVVQRHRGGGWPI